MMYLIKKYIFSIVFHLVVSTLHCDKNPINETQIVAESTMATFKCLMSPIESIEGITLWFFSKDESKPLKRISNIPRHNMTKDVMIIKPVKSIDAGLYSCRFDPDHHIKKNRRFFLFVVSVLSAEGTFVPSMSNNSAALSVLEGGAFKLNVEIGLFNLNVSVVHGTDTPFCNLFAHCQRQDTDHSAVIIVSSLMTNESGSFTINVNVTGEVRSYRLNILVQDLPMTNYTMYVACGVVAAIFGLLSIGCLFVRGCGRSRQPLTDEEEYLAVNLIPSEYEFLREKLSLGKQVGEGTYEIVMKARAHEILLTEPSTTVAVKMMKKSMGDPVLHVLLSELTMMMDVGQHLNIVNLLGAVTRDVRKREIMIIYEFCANGSMDNYLRNNKAGFIDIYNVLRVEPLPEPKKLGNKTVKPTMFTTYHLMYWAVQVASGMAYLEHKNVFHGDLSARNVLLTDQNVAKISDFGAARNVQLGNFYKKQTERPIRWLALECFSDQHYSIKSDVWSYGVFLWELFSLGALPYAGQDSAEKLIATLTRGCRLERPKYATQEMYSHMLRCWNPNPELRPTFQELHDELEALIPAEIRNITSSSTEQQNNTLTEPLL